MAVPKRRTSHQRKSKRRSHHHLRAPALTICPKCKHHKEPHRVCLNCGTYRGNQYLPVKAI